VVCGSAIYFDLGSIFPLQRCPGAQTAAATLFFGKIGVPLHSRLSFCLVSRKECPMKILAINSRLKFIPAVRFHFHRITLSPSDHYLFTIRAYTYRRVRNLARACRCTRCTNPSTNSIIAMFMLMPRALEALISFPPLLRFALRYTGSPV